MTTVQDPSSSSKKRTQAVGATWWYDQFRQYNHAYADRPPDQRDIPVWEYPTPPADEPTSEKRFRRRR